MDESQMFTIIDAIDDIAHQTDSTVDEIIGAITGHIISEQDAGELRNYYIEFF